MVGGPDGNRFCNCCLNSPTKFTPGTEFCRLDMMMSADVKPFGSQFQIFRRQNFLDFDGGVFEGGA